MYFSSSLVSRKRLAELNGMEEMPTAYVIALILAKQSD
jgi:hypothetical protein